MIYGEYDLGGAGNLKQPGVTDYLNRGWLNGHPPGDSDDHQRYIFP